MPSIASGLAGYHVYRATALGQPYVRCTSTPVSVVNYSDAATIAGSVYLVTAVKLETTNSGSWFNASTGVSAVATLKATTNPVDLWKERYFGA